MQQCIKFFIIPYFKWSSTCFGRHTAHHQEAKTALATSGFSYGEGCWTCSWWTLSGTVCLEKQGRKHRLGWSVAKRNCERVHFENKPDISETVFFGLVRHLMYPYKWRRTFRQPALLLSSGGTIRDRHVVWWPPRQSYSQYVIGPTDRAPGTLCFILHNESR